MKVMGGDNGVDSGEPVGESKKNKMAEHLWRFDEAAEGGAASRESPLEMNFHNRSQPEPDPGRGSPETTGRQARPTIREETPV
jgi:hypothetical protein